MSEQDGLGPKPVPTAVQLFRAEREKKRAAATRSWVRGNLSWKFQDYPWCRDFYDFIRSNWGEQVWILAHRRSGKSTTGLVIALEECIRNPFTNVAVVCKSKEQARAICNESFAGVLQDCPRAIAPKLVINEFAYQFKHNGSYIQILPADGLHATKSRGRKFRFILVTEAAFIPRLENLIKSVLGPTLLDVTGKTKGTMVVESTPPTEEVDGSDAEDYERMWREAELDGRSYSLSLSQNTKASPQFVADCVDLAGGVETLTYKREFEIKFLREDNRTAIPEATPDRLMKGDPVRKLPPIIRPVPRPSEADRYASLDPGGTHKTGLLWGFYDNTTERDSEGRDQPRDLLVIEAEAALDNVTPGSLAETVRAIEKDLWGENPGGKLYRYADNNNQILLYDLYREHDLNFRSTLKDNKFAQISAIRSLIIEGRLAIHPRCTLLAKTLSLAKFKKQENRGFQESSEIGHADLLDALIYMARNVRRGALPKQPRQISAVQGIPNPNPKKPLSNGAKAMSDFLKRRRR